MSALENPAPIYSDVRSIVKDGVIDLTPYKNARYLVVTCESFNVQSRLSTNFEWNPDKSLFGRYTVESSKWVIEDGLISYPSQILYEYVPHDNVAIYQGYLNAWTTRSGILTLAEGLNVSMNFDPAPWQLYNHCASRVRISTFAGGLCDVRVYWVPFPKAPDGSDYPVDPSSLDQPLGRPSNGNTLPPTDDGSGGSTPPNWAPNPSPPIDSSTNDDGGTSENTGATQTGRWIVRFEGYDNCTYFSLWKRLNSFLYSQRPTPVTSDLGITQSPCGARDTKIEFFVSGSSVGYGTGGNLRASALVFIPTGGTEPPGTVG